MFWKRNATKSTGGQQSRLPVREKSRPISPVVMMSSSRIQTGQLCLFRGPFSWAAILLASEGGIPISRIAHLTAALTDSPGVDRVGALG